ncbi:hypothetical protein ACFQ0T_15190 [Kitasatospora gansuensis]
MPIEYRKRGGEVKLNALPDGMANLRQLFEHRFRRGTAEPAVVPTAAETRQAAAVPAPPLSVPAQGGEPAQPKPDRRSEQYEAV